MVQWHFGPDTGSRFWLEKAKELDFDPLRDVNCFDDLKKFPLFEDDWLRGGPVRRWVPQKLQDKPIYVFETGGTTGVPKSRMVIDTETSSLVPSSALTWPVRSISSADRKL